MRVKYLGDSFDIVKQSLIRCLGPMGPWAAHPMFSEEFVGVKAAEFSRLLGVPLVSTEVLTPHTDRHAYLASARCCSRHLFLDPDKGILAGRRVRAGDAPLYLRLEELVEIVRARPTRLTLAFDQSLARGRERAGIVRKLAALATAGIHAWAYVSHTGFVLAGHERVVVARAAEVLLAGSRIPPGRLEYGPTLLGRAMHPALVPIVRFLACKRVKATYRAVGEAIGVPARSVGARLGARSTLASWVVSCKTGEPTGYTDAEKDPDLRRASATITNGKDLICRMDQERPEPQ